MLFSTLSSILRGIWLLDAAWAELHAPLIVEMMNGDEGALSKIYSQSLSDVAMYQMAEGAYNVRAGRTDFSPNEGSVAVLDINGPLIRYAECGPGMESMANTVRAVNANPAFVAGVIRMNCPGGEANGTGMLGALLRTSNKPWITCVDDGMAASGGMWLASCTQEIYASNSQSSFGSIGAYCAFSDHSERLAKKGIKVHEVYAPQSTDKNKDFRDAKGGDYTGIQEHLKELVDTFIMNVKEGRGTRLNASAGDPFTGKMYSAAAAQKLGLIDGVKSLDETIARAKVLGSTAKKNPTPKTTTNMSAKKDNNYPALASAAGWNDGYEVTEEGLHVNHDEAAAIDAALVKGAISAGTVATNATEIAAKDAKIIELQGQVSTLTASESSWKEKAEQYGAGAANAGTTTTTTTDVATEDAPAKAEVHSYTAEAMKLSGMLGKKK